MARWPLPSRRSAAWLVVLLLLLAGGGFWFFAGQRMWPQAASFDSKIPKDEFERRVRAYLLDKPEVIAEAMQVLEERQQAAEARMGAEALKTRAEEVLRDPTSPVGGNPQGDVTLVEFFDYNCRYCRQAAPHLLKAEAADPKLRVVYKEFPILGPGSVFAAKAALAAQRQGKYVPLHNALMEAKDTLTETSVLEAAGRVGLDVDRLKVDMAEPVIQDAIARNLALAQALRITGTPAFVIGEHIERGAIDPFTMEQLIHAARQKK